MKYLLSIFFLLPAFAVPAAAQVHHFSVEAYGGGPVANQAAGSPLFVQIVARDTFNTTVSSFSGTVEVTSTGPLMSGGGTSGAFIDGILESWELAFSGTGTFTITATRTGGSETGTSNAFEVSAAALHHFDLENTGGGAIGTQNAGTPFSVRIIARDTFNNVQAGFTGTVDISSTGTLSAGGGTTIAFTEGSLASHTVAYAQGGIVTLTATNSTGAQTGTSNAFTVNNPAPALTAADPSSAVAGGPGFTLTVSGSGFVPPSTVYFGGTGRPTVFVNETTLTATIPQEDIDTSGTFPVAVVTPAPGGGTSDSIGFIVTDPVLRMRVFLQGPFRGDTMSTELSAGGLIPTAQPFTGPPWNYAGPESVSVVPAGAVDWILIGLRSGVSGSGTVGWRAAFVMSDGSVTDLGGSSPVGFPGVPPGSYHVVVWHRNHIPAMSAAARPLDAPADSCDFTRSASFFYGGEANDLGGGRVGLYGGDFSGDGFIDASDFTGPDNTIFLSGYRTSDLNLDGFIDASDFTFPDNNIFTGSNVPE